MQHGSWWFVGDIQSVGGVERELPLAVSTLETDAGALESVLSIHDCCLSTQCRGYLDGVEWRACPAGGHQTFAVGLLGYFLRMIKHLGTTHDLLGFERRSSTLLYAEVSCATRACLSSGCFQQARQHLVAVLQPLPQLQALLMSGKIASPALCVGLLAELNDTCTYSCNYWDAWSVHSPLNLLRILLLSHPSSPVSSLGPVPAPASSTQLHKTMCRCTCTS